MYYFYDDNEKIFIHVKNGVVPRIVSGYDPIKCIGIGWSLGNQVSA